MRRIGTLARTKHDEELSQAERRYFELLSRSGQRFVLVDEVVVERLAAQWRRNTKHGRPRTAWDADRAWVLARRKAAKELEAMFAAAKEYQEKRR